MLKNDKAKDLWTSQTFLYPRQEGESKNVRFVERHQEPILSDKNANLANPTCNLIILKTILEAWQGELFMYFIVKSLDKYEEIFAKEETDNDTIDDFFIVVNPEKSRGSSHDQLKVPEKMFISWSKRSLTQTLSCFFYYSKTFCPFCPFEHV